LYLAVRDRQIQRFLSYQYKPDIRCHSELKASILFPKGRGF
jgi:hypothetical protein